MRLSIGKAVRYATDSSYRFHINAGLGLHGGMPDEEYLRRMFLASIGKPLDLDNPITFNEKLQWLKLHDRNPLYTTLVDKYAVKAWVAERIGEQYVVPTYAKWNRAEDIDVTALPEKFVLKTNHDNGGIAICRNKATFDLAVAKKQLSKRLKRNFYWGSREWPYKDVAPCVFAEEYLEQDASSAVPNDYKVLCFGGTPRLIELHRGRGTRFQTQDFYDTDWNLTSISQSGVGNYKATAIPTNPPSSLLQMLEYSSKLAEGMAHVRVDWYDLGDRLLFGEMTFYDGAGFDPFDNVADDELLGSWIDLSCAYCAN